MSTFVFLLSRSASSFFELLRKPQTCVMAFYHINCRPFLSLFTRQTDGFLILSGCKVFSSDLVIFVVTSIQKGLSREM